MKPFNQLEKSKQVKVEVKKEDDLKIGLITGPVIKVTEFGKK